MKTFAILGILTVLLATSCKKDKMDAAGPVTNDDLLNYNIVLERSVGNLATLRLVYFTKDGSVYTVHMQAAAAYRAVTFQLRGDTVFFDSNGDGTGMYSFQLKKDSRGQIQLGETTFNGTAASVAFASIYKTEDLIGIDVATKAFKGTASDGSTSYLKIKATDQIAGKFYRSYTLTGFEQAIPALDYYQLKKGCWKFEKIANDPTSSLMGLYLPNWKNIQKPVMLVQDAVKLNVIVPYELQ